MDLSDHLEPLIDSILAFVSPALVGLACQTTVACSLQILLYFCGRSIVSWNSRPILNRFIIVIFVYTIIDSHTADCISGVLFNTTTSIHSTFTALVAAFAATAVPTIACHPERSPISNPRNFPKKFGPSIVIRTPTIQSTKYGRKSTSRLPINEKYNLKILKLNPVNIIANKLFPISKRIFLFVDRFQYQKQKELETSTLQIVAQSKTLL